MRNGADGGLYRFAYGKGSGHLPYAHIFAMIIRKIVLTIRAEM